MEPDKPTTSTRRGRVLLENGVAALVFGVACLVLPLFLRDSPSVRTLGSALRIPAYVGFALGILLLGLHALARRNPPGIATPAADNDAAAAPPDRWSAAVFEGLDASRFEAVCERLFAQAGLTTRREPRAPEGAADIALYSRHAQGPVAIVRCRHGEGREVGMQDLLEFHAAVASLQLKRGSYATASTFTDEASRFAKDHGINALDRERLLALVASRTADEQRDLLAAAYGTADARAPGTRTSQ